MSKVAIYLRASTDRQDYENQRGDLLAWAQSNQHEIVREYADVLSGAKPRETISRIMEDAHRHEFEILGFWKVDRLSREGALPTLLYLDRLDKMGIKVYSHQEPWMNPSMPFYEVVVAVVAALAAMERGIIAERTKRGIERAKARGVRLGRPPGAQDKMKRRRSGYLKRWENNRGVNKTGK